MDRCWRTARHGRRERCTSKDGDVQDVKPSDPRDKSQWCGDPERFGLWLDKRLGPPDPFEDEKRYPGVRVGARGRTVPVGSYYGYATGILGLRLFPNPDFDEKAAKAWDSERYYTDPAYYNRKDLIRPYRVGMSCGFCHVGPSPIDPPKDPENPDWKNLNSNPGAQYFWLDRIFFWNPYKRHENFIYQLFHTSLPGSLDTSLVSSDNINNPRTMNAVYNIGPRLQPALRWGKEQLGSEGLKNKQFQDFPQTAELSQFYTKPDTVMTPHVLKDGADSVGAMGALNRVYLNIGTFGEEWLLHFKALVGGKRVTPIEINVARQNSAYFKATEAQTFDTAQFFLKTTDPHLLADAPGAVKGGGLGRIASWGIFTCYYLAATVVMLWVGPFTTATSANEYAPPTSSHSASFAKTVSGASSSSRSRNRSGP